MIERVFRARNAVALGSVAALGLVGCLTPPALATFPGKNGRLASTSRSDRLFTSRADGSDRHRLVKSRAADPAWSPNGREVAFIGPPKGGRSGNEIYAVDFRTHRVRAITRVLGHASSPSWSPDGKEIAFLRTRLVDFSDAELWVLRSDGGSKRKLADAFGGAADAEWSPTASRLAYTGVDGDLYSIASAGGQPMRIVDEPEMAAVGDISWAPDGQWVAFMEYRWGPCDYCTSLAKVRVDGGLPQPLESRRFGTSSFAPLWAPNGSSIRYCRERGDLNRFPSFVAASMRPDGSGLRSLPKASCIASWQPRPAAPSG
jgi:Tol biopolymer transport system component